MNTLNINEKINTKSFDERPCDRQHDIKTNYQHTAQNKNKFGNYGGGVWEQPNSQQLINETLHVDPRYISYGDEKMISEMQYKEWLNIAI